MQPLFRHLDELTGNRDRVRLESALVEALYDLLQAEQVRLYKLFPAGSEFLAGTAVQVDSQGFQVNDDGMAWPEDATALHHLPLIARCQQDGNELTEYDEALHQWHHVFPVAIAGAPFGFISIRREQTLSADEYQLAEGFIRVFQNCLALLDYSESDTLTGLLNRKTFDEFLFRILSSLHGPDDEALSLTQTPHRRHIHEQAKQHWLGVMDIDRFKRINDNYGHMIGDEVLVMVANKMREGFRGIDKLFRFGGEEFVVILKPTEHENALMAFNRFRQMIEVHPFPQVGQVTISIGFAPISLKDTSSMVLDNADRALYWAKESGRNRVASYLELLADGRLEPPPEQVSDVEFF